MKTGAGQPGHGAEMNSLTTCLALVSLHPSREAPVDDFFTTGNRRDQSSSVSRHQRRFTKGGTWARTQQRRGRLSCARVQPFQVGGWVRSLHEAGGRRAGVGVRGGCVRGGSSSRLVGRGMYAAGWRRQAGVLGSGVCRGRLG